eukprot:Sdes_comp18457_c0_seq1m8422
MVAAWYMVEPETSQERGLPLQKTPPKSVSLEELSQLNVHYQKVPVDQSGMEAHLEEIHKFCVEKKYANHDVVSIQPSMQNYETMAETFFKEHIHEDDEVRYILEGNGFFDIRDLNDQWIRIECSQGDLLVFPAGIYHRFTVKKDHCLKAMRIFKEMPKWIPINRPHADENIHRKQYLNSLAPTAA